MNSRTDQLECPHLTLRNSNRIELKKLVTGSSTMIASKTFPLTTGTWYTLRIEVADNTLNAYVDGAHQFSATDGQFSAGDVGGATFNASAEFDDFVVTALSTTPTPTPTPTPEPTPTPDPGEGPVGYASVNALGQNGTTGGARGPVMTVSTSAASLDYIFRTGPYVVQADGMITVPAAVHKAASDKTIIGLGSNSGTSGGGRNMTNGVKNITIRVLTPGAGARLHRPARCEALKRLDAPRAARLTSVLP